MLILKEVRKSKNMTVPELSRKSGVPVRTIEDIERRQNGTLSNVAKLAKALCVTLNDVWIDEPGE